MKINWIKTSERLPKDNKKYLVCGNNYNSCEKMINLSSFEPTCGWDRGRDVYNVFYWSEDKIEMPEFPCSNLDIEYPMILSPQERLQPDSVEKDLRFFYTEGGQNTMLCSEKDKETSE